MFDHHASQRRLKPKRESADQAEQSNTDKPSRKRLTASACVACRKRKSKCDSTKPACTACTSVYNTDCSYDTDHEPARKAPVRRPSTRPDPIPSTIIGLRDIIAALQLHPEPDTILLNQLKNAQSRLENLAFNGAAVEPPLTPASSVASLSVLPAIRNPTTTHFYPSMPTPQRSNTPSALWFEEPISDKLVMELFADYISCHHSYFPLFSISHFFDDFHSGGTRYCSTVLVYAILAVACTYWKGKFGADPNLVAKAQELEETFAAIARRKLVGAITPSLPTVQALAILGFRQGSLGDLTGAYYWHGAALRMALAMHMHLDVDLDVGNVEPIEREVRSLTFWGIYNFEMALGIFTGKVSQITNSSIGIPKPSFLEKRDSFALQPPERIQYAEDQLNREIKSLRYVSHFCELSKVVNEVNLTYYAPQHQITITNVVYALQRYNTWEQGLPVESKSPDLGGAEVSYLHMYYRQVIIQLLRPFLSYPVETLGLNATKTCLQRAIEIHQLWRALKAQYTIWALHMLVIWPLRDAAHVFLLNLHELSSLGFVTEIIEDLRTFAFLHPAASGVISSLHDIAAHHHIDHPPGLFDGHFHDVKSRSSVPRVSLAAFIMQAQIAVDTPPPHGVVDGQLPTPFDPPIPGQDMAQWETMGTASQTQAAFFPEIPDRGFPSFMARPQMSGASQMGYQMMPPYVAQELGTQRPQME